MKKFIAAIAAVSLFALTSCGTSQSEKDSTPAPTEPDSTTAPEETSEPAEETPTEAAEAQENEQISTDFPELNFEPESSDIQLTLAEANLPDDFDAAYITRKLNYYGGTLFGISFSIMDSHDNIIYDNYYDIENGAMGTPTYTRRTYDAEGRQTAYEEIFNGSTDYSFKYEYDANGFLIGDSFTTGDAEYYNKYTNDDYGNPVTIDSHNAMDDSVVTHTYTYDTNGSILTDTSEGGDPMGNGTVTNDYDEQGRLVRTEITCVKIPDISYTEYAYDNADNVIFEHYWTSVNGEVVNGMVSYKAYDSKGRVVRQYEDRKNLGGDDSYTVYEYTDLK